MTGWTPADFSVIRVRGASSGGEAPRAGAAGSCPARAEIAVRDEATLRILRRCPAGDYADSGRAEQREEDGVTGPTVCICHGLICGWDDEAGDWQMTILHVADGTRQILGPCHQVPSGRIDNRLVMDNRASGQFPDTALVTTDLHGGDVQPFLTINPPGNPGLFDTWMTRSASFTRR